MFPSNNQAAGQSHLSFGAMSFPDLTSLKIGPPIASKKGGVKQRPISLNWKPLQFILGTVASPLRVPFEVAPFNSEDSLARLTLNLEIVDSLQKEFLQQLDAQILHLVSQNAADLMKKTVTKETLSVMYKQCLPENGTYEPVLRTKINLEAPRQVKVWNKDHEITEIPKTWKNMRVAVCVTAKTVWINSSMLGVTLDATDVLICENDVQPVCPFGMED